jgi:hypothetical protein
VLHNEARAEPLAGKREEYPKHSENDKNDDLEIYHDLEYHSIAARVFFAGSVESNFQPR